MAGLKGWRRQCGSDDALSLLHVPATPEEVLDARVLQRRIPGTLVRADEKRGGRGDSRCGEQVFERGFLWSAKGITSRRRVHELLTCSSKALALPFQAFQVSLRAAESESAGADAEATGSNVVVGYEWPFGGELTMRKNTGGKS